MLCIHRMETRWWVHLGATWGASTNPAAARRGPDGAGGLVLMPASSLVLLHYAGRDAPAFANGQACRCHCDGLIWRAIGLAGLVPARPGPRRAHKLTREVVEFARQAREDDPALRPAGDR